jgi:hypothetical protein
MRPHRLAVHHVRNRSGDVDREPVGAHFAAKSGKDKVALIPVDQAVAQAIKVGDRRYMSVRHCVDEVSGYPAAAEPGKPEIPSPWTIGVKPLGGSCYESLGHEGSVRTTKHQAYAVEYNRRMYEHNKTMARELIGAR